MKLSVGFSPCPNDTFIFDALVHHKIDTEGIEVSCFLEDVETLNEWALEGRLDITKLSYHAYAYAADNYEILNSGSALGNNCGPLLIKSQDNASKSPSDWTVAIPGRLTTANMLFSMFYPTVTQKKYMVFSDVEPAIINKEVDAGVIIHENRFTFQEKGLIKILDLGNLWEESMQLPIPLGGIMAKRSLSHEIKTKFNKVLKKSIEYAFEHNSQNCAFVKQHAQEMSETVIHQHISLYVNKYSLDLGNSGQDAIEQFYKKSVETDIIKPLTYNYFLHKY